MIKQTTESCTYCQSQLVSEEHQEVMLGFDGLTCGGKLPMKTVSSGYFCSGCGLKYHLLPSEVKKYVRQQIDRQEALERELEAKERAKQAKWEEALRDLRNNAVKTAKLMQECEENTAKSTLTFP